MEFDRFITLWIIIILTTLLAQLNGLVAGAMTNMQVNVYSCTIKNVMKSFNCLNFLDGSVFGTCD